MQSIQKLQVISKNCLMSVGKGLSLEKVPVQLQGWCEILAIYSWVRIIDYRLYAQEYKEDNSSNIFVYHAIKVVTYKVGFLPWHQSPGSLTRGQKCSTTIVSYGMFSVHIRNNNLSDSICIWTIVTLENNTWTLYIKLFLS